MERSEHYQSCPRDRRAGRSPGRDCLLDLADAAPLSTSFYFLRHPLVIGAGFVAYRVLLLGLETQDDVKRIAGQAAAAATLSN